MVASDLDPKFTFESFVVGPANRPTGSPRRWRGECLTRQARLINPLFIYSSSGLGKSHILNSIVHHAAKYYQSAVAEDPRLGEGVFIKLGAIALENSNTEAGAALWRRALELNPDNSALRAKVDQLGDTAGT